MRASASIPLIRAPWSPAGRVRCHPRAARPGGTDLLPTGFAGGDRLPHRLRPVSWGELVPFGQGLQPRPDGRLVLVVEDEFLIAMDLELLLRRHGWRVLGPAATVAEALRLLADERPDVALLDLNLRGELATPVAEELRAGRAVRAGERLRPPWVGGDRRSG